MGSEYVDVQVEAKTSRWAIASFVMGLLTVTCILWPVFALPAVVCAIIALVKIKRSSGRLKGKEFAAGGILLPIMIAFFLVMLMPPLEKIHPIAKSIVCATNLKGLGTALYVYANDYDDRLPPEDWCDLLIMEADVSPKSFICPVSEEIEGESSYAMNRSVAGKKLDELPGNIVLLFETSIGLEADPRTTPIQERRHYDFLSGSGRWYAENHQVHKDRWNQYGGAGDVLIRHDESKPAGCNVLFADGHTEFVPADKIAGLKWTWNE
jgi:prepilin-type processing-associated H-X9-DG protein